MVLCWGLDRLSRRGAEDMLSYVRRLTDTGCRLWSLKDPWAESTADPMTRELLFSVFATIARFESERRSERIKAGIERRRREGKPIGGATTRKGHGKGSRHSGERKSAAWTRSGGSSTGGAEQGARRSTAAGSARRGRRAVSKTAITVAGVAVAVALSATACTTAPHHHKASLTVACNDFSDWLNGGDVRALTSRSPRGARPVPTRQDFTDLRTQVLTGKGKAGRPWVQTVEFDCGFSWWQEPQPS